MRVKNLSQLKKIADREFSRAVRLRDSTDGYGNCITCTKLISVKEGHAGHFQSRRHSSTRFDEENVNLQCSLCNAFRAGEQYQYGMALELKYGEGTAEKLAKKAQEYHKLTFEELEEVIHDAREEIKFYES